MVFAMAKTPAGVLYAKFNSQVVANHRPIRGELDELKANAQLMSASDKLLESVWDLMGNSQVLNSPSKKLAMEKARKACMAAGYPLPQGW
jgi:hypothetical protein